MNTHSSVRRAWKRWRMRVNVAHVHEHHQADRGRRRGHEPRYRQPPARRWSQGLDSPHA